MRTDRERPGASIGRSEEHRTHWWAWATHTHTHLHTHTKRKERIKYKSPGTLQLLLSCHLVPAWSPFRFNDPVVAHKSKPPPKGLCEQRQTRTPRPFSSQSNLLSLLLLLLLLVEAEHDSTHRLAQTIGGPRMKWPSLPWTDERSLRAGSACVCVCVWAKGGQEHPSKRKRERDTARE